MAKITAPTSMIHTRRRGKGRGKEEGKQTLNIFIPCFSGLHTVNQFKNTYLDGKPRRKFL